MIAEFGLDGSTSFSLCRGPGGKGELWPDQLREQLQDIPIK